MRDCQGKLLLVLALTVAGCVGWPDRTLEITREAATAAPEQDAQRNRAAIRDALQSTTSSPTKESPAMPLAPEPSIPEGTPATEPSAPRMQLPAVPDVTPSVRPLTRSSSPSPGAHVVIPFTPTPLQPPIEPVRIVPPYTIQMPAGSVYPNTLRCVPDITGGSICR